MMTAIFPFIRANNSLVKIATTSLRQIGGCVQIKILRPNEIKCPSLKRTGKTVALETVEKLLDVRKAFAVELVTSAKMLYFASEGTMTDNFNILSNNNVNKSTIIKHPALLGIPTRSHLEENISCLKSLPFDINQTIYLALLEPVVLQKYVKKEDFLARIDILTRKLETTVDVVICAFVKRSFLLSSKLHRLEEVISILKSNHVTAEDILKDMWVLLYTPKLIQERFDLIRTRNIEPIKTWMIRCPLPVLDKHIQRYSDNKLILGDNTLTGYLSGRLNCTTEEAKGLMIKHPALQKKRMSRVKEIIDFLYAEGFQPYHICRVPKVLLHSVQTMKKRLGELKKQSVHVDSLHLLTKSQNQYLQCYQTLVKSSSINKLQTEEAEKSI